MALTVNYITDKSGKKKAVQLSLRDWQRLIQEHQQLLDYKRTKSELLEALTEIELIEKGKKKAKTLSEFLNAN
jgi:cell fate (sporulation/competence/biofilm development) regulator YlbF (YheA/YmcA/DUF963 family)